MKRGEMAMVKGVGVGVKFDEMRLGRRVEWTRLWNKAVRVRSPFNIVGG